MSELKVLSSKTNAVIAKHIDREYPGVLIQGDTLKIILDEIGELKEELLAEDLDSAKEITASLQNRFFTIIRHYEEVLKDHNIPLPYRK